MHSQLSPPVLRSGSIDKEFVATLPGVSGSGDKYVSVVSIQLNKPQVVQVAGKSDGFNVPVRSQVTAWNDRPLIPTVFVTNIA